MMTASGMLKITGRFKELSPGAEEAQVYVKQNFLASTGWMDSACLQQNLPKNSPTIIIGPIGSIVAALVRSRGF